MPRNGSGTYTLPAGNPVVSGTVIDSDWANDTLADMANEITNSLSRTGAGGMLAAFRVADGTVNTPGLAFTNETNTGLYRAASGEIWFTVGGVAVAQITANGLLLPSSRRITLPAPVNGTDAANKTYVDDRVDPVIQYANFYLGPKATDPTLNNSGGALTEGATYWNTALDQMRVYNGTNWEPMPSTAALLGQTFSGDAVETDFTLANPSGPAINLEVFISGVRQVPTTDYTVTGATLAFTVAPPTGTNNIFVRYAQLLNVQANGAADVIYLPSGTGAVATNVQSKLREFVSVFDFMTAAQIVDVKSGAALLDVTAAIQAAIDSLGTAGGGVYCPAGRYKITSTLVFSASHGATLSGPNGTALWNGLTFVREAGAVIVKSASMTTEAVRNNNSSGVSLENIAIVGEPGNTGDGIYMLNGQTMKLFNVGVAGMGGVGIRIGPKSGASGNCNHWQLVGVTSMYNGSHGVLLHDETLVGGPNANAGTANGLHVAGNGGDGLRIENGQFNTFSGLLSQQNAGYGVSLIGTVPISLYATFNGGDVETNGAGEWNIGPNAKHLVFCGAFPNLPSFNPDSNFATLISGLTNRFRNVDVKSGTAVLSSLNLGQASNLTYYNTGQFIPTIAGTTTAGTNTYSSQEGYYTRIGNLVFVQGYVKLTAKGVAPNNMTGTLYIGNLPFAQLNSSQARAPMQIQATGGLVFGAGYSSEANGRTFENLNRILLYKRDTSTGALVEIFSSEIADTTGFYFSGSYVAAPT
jgi:hypothetical protein